MKCATLASFRARSGAQREATGHKKNESIPDTKELKCATVASFRARSGPQRQLFGTRIVAKPVFGNKIQAGRAN